MQLKLKIQQSNVNCFLALMDAQHNVQVAMYLVIIIWICYSGLLIILGLIDCTPEAIAQGKNSYS